MSSYHRSNRDSDSPGQHLFIDDQGVHKGLCSFCRAIPFSALGFHNLPMYPSFEASITYNDVRKRSESCGLCQMTLVCLRSYAQQTPHPATGYDFSKWTLKASMIPFKDVPTDQAPLYDGSCLWRLKLIWQSYKAFDSCWMTLQKWIDAANKPPTANLQEPNLHIEGIPALRATNHAPPEVLYSGRIRPSQVSASLIGKWKRLCLADHATHCEDLFSGRRQAGMRLIDVNRRCLVQAGENDSYVVLSYVWGKQPIPMLTTSTYTFYHQDGSLDAELLPATIEDAISVARYLDEKYLWVNCLCIIQDSPDDILSFIPCMDSIFGCAFATIVAAAGVDVYSGLPGLRPQSRRDAPRLFTARGIHVIETLEAMTERPELRYSSDRGGDKLYIGDEPHLGSESYLGDSVWLHRGWTFQERLFSRRSLIFSADQVYWECGKSSWCEDSVWESVGRSYPYRHTFADTDFRLPWGDSDLSFERTYWKLVEELSRRQLTKQEDGLAAFAGVLAAFERDQDRHFFWGLPVRSFSVALLWPNDYGRLSRREAYNSQKSRDESLLRTRFPSWSWAGWIGVISFKENTRPESAQHDITLHSIGVVFYRIDDAGNPHMLQESSSSKVIEIRSFQRRYDGSHTATIQAKDLPEKALERSIAPTALCFWAHTIELPKGPRVNQNDYTWLKSLKVAGGRSDYNMWSQVDSSQPIGLVAVGASRDPVDDEDLSVMLLPITWQDGLAYRVGDITSLDLGIFNSLKDVVWKKIILC